MSGPGAASPDPASPDPASPGTASPGTSARASQPELPGDPVCLLRRVCPACGAVADEDPPTRCPQCHAVLTGD